MYEDINENGAASDMASDAASGRAEEAVTESAELTEPVKIIPAGDEIINRRLKITETKNRQMPVLTVEEDLLVPDVRPDLEKILSIDAVPEVSGCETYTSSGGKDMLKISGNLEISTLYLPLENEQGIVAISSKIPFRHDVELESIPGKDVEVDGSVDSLSSKVVNERKIRINANVVFRMADNVETGIELLEEVKDDSLLLKKEKIGFTDMAFSRKETAEISENLQLRDNQPQPVKILKCDFNIVENHRQLSKGKVILESGLYCNILYMPEKHDADETVMPVFYRGKADITQFMRLPDIPQDEITGIVTDYRIASAEIKISDGISEADEMHDSSESQNSHNYFVLTAEVISVMSVYRDIQREVVTDMYHRTEKLDFSTKKHSISKLCGSAASDVSVRDTLVVPDEKGNVQEVPYISVKVENLNGESENDRCSISGNLALNVIFNEEETGRINCWKTSVPFRAALEIPGACQSGRIICDAGIRDIWFDRLNGKQIDFSCSVGIRAFAWDTSSCDFIDKVCYIQDDEDQHRRAGIVVYITNPGDTQWSIAKKFRTTMESIAQVNGLQENENPKEGRRLIIV